MSEWKEFKLGDITDWFSGGTPSKQNESYWNGKIPWISARSLNGTKVSESEIKITQVGLENGSRLAIEDDILLLVRGSGLFNSIPVAIVEKPVAFNQDIKAIRLKKEFKYISPWFILFWFYSNTRTLYSIMEETGIGAGKFDTNQLKALTIKIPDEKVLNEITKTFKSLDSKISLLRQQNQTLEELAQTLFKRWFVDFEFPDEKSEPYKSSGGKMIESELGEIPEGWRVSSLSSIADFLNGLACQKFPVESESEKLPVLKIKELGNGISENSDWANSNVDLKFIIKSGDIIFSWSGTLMLKIWDGKKCILNQHLFKVTSDKLPDWFIYQWTKIHLNHFISVAKSKATTMGHITRSHLDEALCFVPDKELLKDYNQTFSSLLNNFKNNNQELQTLASLRDTLLPKLMSGELMLK
jgi:type I restriction enzyme, S subunit